MTPEQAEIARRIAASPWFRWMTGMLECYGDRVLRVMDDGRIETTELVDASCGYHHDREHGMSHADGMNPPDLTDPATVGCMYQLACLRWGCRQILTDICPHASRPAIWEAMDSWRAEIPAEIHSCLPDITAAVCAALLHEETV